MCKVDDLIERYDLTPSRDGYETLDEYLLARWKGVDGLESEGYQALTEWFNKQVLRGVYDEQGRDIAAYRIDAEYEILTGDRDLRHDELAADLAADSIDTDELEDEFVSWSTMRRHLNGCLDGEKEPARSTSDWELESVEVARSKTREKARAALHSLSSKGRLPGAASADVDIQVKLTCPECPTRIPIEDAVERGYICKDHGRTVPRESDGDEAPSGVQQAILPPGLAQIGVSLTDDLVYTLDFVAAMGGAI
ncbi:rod-determining factor RdfA [Halosolutus gelatinilyticus]|uniref:rod-determining factor RdfA n=1 Tax=Halosolutus gelatinilyticus TaxID=2931975 RepID=UPI001FF5AA43|nr:rod-determining factor RdfA [Halosolutus gelatinilyticus]